MRGSGRWGVRILNEQGNYLGEWGRVDKSEGRDSRYILRSLARLTQNNV